MNDSMNKGDPIESRYQVEYQKYVSLKKQLELKNEYLADLQKEVAATETKNAQILKACVDEHDRECNSVQIRINEALDIKDENSKALQKLHKQIEELEEELYDLLHDETETSVNSTNNSLSQSFLETCCMEKKELENLKKEMQEKLENVLTENATLVNELEMKQNNIEEIEFQIKELQNNDKSDQSSDAPSVKITSNKETSDKPVSLYDEMEKKGMASSELLKDTIAKFNSLQFMKTAYKKRLDMFKGQFDVLKASNRDIFFTHETFLNMAKNKLTDEVDDLIGELKKTTAAVNLENSKKTQSYESPSHKLQYFVPMIKQSQKEIQENNQQRLKQKLKQIQMYKEILEKRCLMFRTQKLVLEQKLKNLILRMQEDEKDLAL